MGSHRSDVEPTTVDQVSPYVGRRRALAVEEQSLASPSPSSYVGRRRATVDAVPTTAELQALVEISLDDTAPRPRVSEPRITEPAGRPTAGIRPADTLPRIDVPLPRRSPDPLPLHIPTPLFVDDSRSDIPAVGRPADLTADQTVTMPLVPPPSVGRRRAAGSPSRGRALPSLPVAAGIAAIAVAVTGVVTTGHASLTPVSSQHVMQASAMSGFTGSGVVGDRAATLSRSFTGRNDPAATQRAATQRNRALTRMNYKAGGYDKQLAKNIWVLPITAGHYVLTARFGQVSGLWRTVHTGLDFACPTGTPIHALANGTITFVGWDGSYGNKTVETLADGTEIWYAHQSKFETQVGATVKQGEVIGLVGATGNTTGPHVHIEVRPGGGDPVDPDPAFREHGVNPDAFQE